MAPDAISLPVMGERVERAAALMHNTGLILGLGKYEGGWEDPVHRCVFFPKNP